MGPEVNRQIRYRLCDCTLYVHTYRTAGRKETQTALKSRARFSRKQGKSILVFSLQSINYGERFKRTADYKDIV
jgi:DNA gyrase/topoisomerase IV subunit A